MTFLSNLFGGPRRLSPHGEDKLGASHEAIREARSGKISVQEMLKRLAAGPVLVPLAEPPHMEGSTIQRWQPATVAKADGSQWLVVFTNSDLALTFIKQNPSYAHGLSVEVRWVLQSMPQAHGLLFNIGSEAMFEWNAAGLSRYKHDVLGMPAS